MIDLRAVILYFMAVIFLFTNDFNIFLMLLDALDIGGNIMKSRTSGTYQVMPKVGTERTSQMDESASSLYKGKGESRLFSHESIRFFSPSVLT